MWVCDVGDEGWRRIHLGLMLTFEYVLTDVMEYVPNRDSTPAGIDAASVMRAIRTRRNVKEFTDREVDASLVREIIEAAVWAPNHRHTEPWRFIVLPRGSRKREEVADLVHDWTYRYVKNPNPERRVQSASQIRDEVLRIPVMMYVYSVPGADDEVTEENYAATCCAVQNMLLAAHAYGLSVGWSTGRTCKCEEVHSAIGAEADWRVVGAFSIGYGASVDNGKRMPIEEVTRWMS